MAFAWVWIMGQINFECPNSRRAMGTTPNNTTREKPGIGHVANPGCNPGMYRGGRHPGCEPGFRTPGYTREGPYPGLFLAFGPCFGPPLPSPGQPRHAETGRAFDRAYVRAPVKARATLSRGSPSRHDACLHRCRHAHHKEEQRREGLIKQVRTQQ